MLRRKGRHGVTLIDVCSWFDGPPAATAPTGQAVAMSTPKRRRIVPFRSPGSAGPSAPVAPIADQSREKSDEEKSDGAKSDDEQQEISSGSGAQTDRKDDEDPDADAESTKQASHETALSGNGAPSVELLVPP